jgi:glycosyltransferase involved in cell wall biosynthesis
MAGLAVCIGPSPSMMEIVNQYGCGCIASSFRPEDLADALNRLDTEEINTMRKASRKAALELNAENEMGKLVRLYQQLLA